MSGADEPERRREAAIWLVVAREDVRVARACLALNPPALGVSAYHCQQAAEKLAKGLLVTAAVTFRRTHDIDKLADLVASSYPRMPRPPEQDPPSHGLGHCVSLSRSRGYP
jgi:HEPN domain-containing protein